MEDAKPIKTPMATNGHLDLDGGGNPVDQKLYRSMISSLLYLTASSPDIMIRVCMCARFQAAPREYHLTAVKRILRYLKYTPNIGLWYPRVLILIWLDSWIRIMRGVRLIGKAPPVVINFLEDLLYLGH